MNRIRRLVELILANGLLIAAMPETSSLRQSAAAPFEGAGYSFQSIDYLPQDEFRVAIQRLTITRAAGWSGTGTKPAVVVEDWYRPNGTGLWHNANSTDACSEIGYLETSRLGVAIGVRATPNSWRLKFYPYGSATYGDMELSRRDFIFLQNLRDQLVRDKAIAPGYPIFEAALLLKRMNERKIRAFEEVLVPALTRKFENIKAVAEERLLNESVQERANQVAIKLFSITAAINRRIDELKDRQRRLLQNWGPPASTGQAQLSTNEMIAGDPYSYVATLDNSSVAGLTDIGDLWTWQEEIAKIEGTPISGYEFWYHSYLGAEDAVGRLLSPESLAIVGGAGALMILFPPAASTVGIVLVSIGSTFVVIEAADAAKKIHDGIEQNDRKQVLDGVRGASSASIDMALIVAGHKVAKQTRSRAAEFKQPLAANGGASSVEAMATADLLELVNVNIQGERAINGVPKAVSAIEAVVRTVASVTDDTALEAALRKLSAFRELLKRAPSELGVSPEVAKKLLGVATGSELPPTFSPPVELTFGSEAPTGATVGVELTWSNEIMLYINRKFPTLIGKVYEAIQYEWAEVLRTRTEIENLVFDDVALMPRIRLYVEGLRFELTRDPGVIEGSGPAIAANDRPRLIRLVRVLMETAEKVNVRKVTETILKDDSRLAEILEATAGTSEYLAPHASIGGGHVNVGLELFGGVDEVSVLLRNFLAQLFNTMDWRSSGVDRLSISRKNALTIREMDIIGGNAAKPNETRLKDIFARYDEAYANDQPWTNQRLIGEISGLYRDFIANERNFVTNEKYMALNLQHLGPAFWLAHLELRFFGPHRDARALDLTLQLLNRELASIEATTNAGRLVPIEFEAPADGTAITSTEAASRFVAFLKKLKVNVGDFIDVARSDEVQTAIRDSLAAEE